MKGWAQGFAGLQVLFVTAAIGIAALIAVPKYQSIEDRLAVSEALDYAGDLQRRLAQSFEVSGRFPTSNKHASTMISSRASVPGFIRDLRIQPDRTGQTVTIKVFLKDGVVKNLTGEKQFVYISGNRNLGDQSAIEWHCGAAGLGAELLPDECRG